MGASVGGSRTYTTCPVSHRDADNKCYHHSVIEMQAFLGELIEGFQFDLPKGNVEIQCAPAGSGMVPIVRGKPELGAALPLRISLVQ